MMGPGDGGCDFGGGIMDKEYWDRARRASFAQQHPFVVIGLGVRFSNERCAARTAILRQAEGAQGVRGPFGAMTVAQCSDFMWGIGDGTGKGAVGKAGMGK